MEFLTSLRTSRSGDDPIFALHSEATKRRAQGEAIVDATVGVLLNDNEKLALMSTIPDVLRDLPASVGAAYPPIAGSPDFRRAVIKDILGSREAAGWAVAVATPGASGALRHGIANFLEPQQTLLTTSFYWGPYRTMADELDRNFVTFRMFQEDAQFDAAAMEQKLNAVLEMQGRALLFLNSPCHNPTGYTLDEQDWSRVVDIVERASRRGPVAVLLDVAYARYCAEGLGPTVDHLLRLAGKAMILFAWSASKAFTQYGLRVGALVAVHPDAAVRRKIENALSFSCRGTWSTCNAAGMAAVARVLEDPDLRARADRERAALKELLDRRVALWNDLAGKAGLRYARISGGFFTTVFCDNAAEAAARLKGDGIFIVPLATALRVALCSVPERDLPRIVGAIAKHI